MTAIFFKISDRQEEELKYLMEDEGYSSKAEFFRFLIKFYKYTRTSEEVAFEKTADELASVLRLLKKKGKLGQSLEKQLADV